MKRIISLIIAAVITVGCAGALAGCSGSKVDLAKFYTVSAKGLDGEGVLSYDFDDDAFEYALQEKNAKQIENLTSTDSGEIMLYRFYDSIKCKFDKTQNLKNGDKVTGTITYDEETAKSCKLKIKASKLTFKVEGLKRGEKIDVFKGVKLIFSGTSPNAVIEDVEGAKDYGFSVRYNYKPRGDGSGYAVGDKVTVTAEFDKTSAGEAGYIVEKSEKTFTVEGVDELIIHSTGLKLADIGEIKAESDKTANEYFIGKKYTKGFIETDYVKMYKDSYDGRLYKASSISNQKFSKAILYSNDNENHLMLLYTFDANGVNGKNYPSAIGVIHVKNIVKHTDGSYTYNSLSYVSSAFANMSEYEEYMSSNDYDKLVKDEIN